jgi:hypothetical protein
VTNTKSQLPRHPKYDELVELIDNARNGVTNDLVMDSQPQNQVSKCPITQKPIKNPFKNADCGHVYERDAIMQFTKGKSGIKRYEVYLKKFKVSVLYKLFMNIIIFFRCPVSGCPQMVSFRKD